MSPVKGLALVWAVIRVVRTSGAVSPTTRAMPSKTAVTNPVLAAGIITWKKARRCGAPKAKAADRRSPGTSFKTSSLIRITVGSIKSTNADEANQPAGRETPVETKTENDMKIDEVVELYEKIADRKVELQIKRLDEETQ